MSKQKLELMWVGKEKRAKLEPRILIEDPEKSYHADKRVSDNDIFDNMLIHGDNLLALKALEQDYAGRVKCIYIDPPYNTGNAFEHYDDGLEHSIWLSLMRERLELLKNLLSDDGSIWISIDDTECHYLKVILDETFGRSNFISSVTVKSSTPSGPKTKNKIKTIIKQKDYLLVYRKSENFRINPQYVRKDKWDTHFNYFVDKESEIVLPLIDVLKSKKILREEDTLRDFDINKKEHRRFYLTYSDFICQTQSYRNEDYKAISRKNGEVVTFFNKGTSDELMFYNGRQLTPLTQSLQEVLFCDVYQKDFSVLLCDFWSDIDFQNTQNEGGVSFPASKKPEALVQRILRMSTNPGDLVLDSFLGSGTTAAVAHKMGRRWIGIELGEHCDTHCVPRLKKVIDGEDAGGITKSANWRGGGGFRYYNLAPSLVKFDEWGNPVINKEFNENMLVRALCKVEGFNFDPSPDVYWKQGKSTESDFIYVTTQHLTAQMLQKLSDDVGENCTLLICCGSFDGKKDSYGNLTIKKIPKAILKKCEWSHDDYSLEIKNLPMSAPDPQPSSAPRKKSLKKQQDNNQQMNLFGEVE